MRLRDFTFGAKTSNKVPAACSQPQVEPCLIYFDKLDTGFETQEAVMFCRSPLVSDLFAPRFGCASRDSLHINSMSSSSSSCRWMGSTRAAPSATSRRGKCSNGCLLRVS